MAHPASDTAPAIAPAEMARRRQLVDEARHSIVMEGGQVTAATRADEEAYVGGHIDLDELGQRVRSRYGVA